MGFERMQFDPEDGLKNDKYFPDTPGSGAEAREQFQRMFDQVRERVNALIAKLENEDSGSSGAESIGSKYISGINNEAEEPVTNLWEQIKWLYDNMIAGSSYNGVVTEDKLLSNVVTESKIANGAVTAEKLEAGLLDSMTLSDNTVDTAKIVDAAVTADKLALNAVTGLKLANAVVTDSKLALNAVTTLKMMDGAVTTAKILDGNVTTAKILDGSVTEAKLETSIQTKLATERTRKITVSAASPSGGASGDIWLKYA